MRERDRSDNVLAELYESSNVILPSDLVDNPPVTTPDARWLMYGDQALATAQEEQRRIKEGYWSLVDVLDREIRSLAGRVLFANPVKRQILPNKINKRRINKTRPRPPLG